MMFKMLLIMVLLMAFAGSQMRVNDVSVEEFINMTDKLDYDAMNVSEPFKKIGDDVNESYISRSIAKYADTMLYMGFDGSKNVVEYGYNNPDKPYKRSQLDLKFETNSKFEY